jgi:hypothetical protein
MRLAPLLLLCALTAGPADIPTDPIAAHLYADRVLLPELVSKMNDWMLRHPTDRQEGSGDHAQLNDAKDRQRYEAVRKSVEMWLKAMKAAGFEQK